MAIEEKRWKKAFEEEILKEWFKDYRYSFKEDKEKRTFSIDTPPPYVNTPIHVGQATTYVLMDMFARYKRMCGYNVLFPLGLDRNGLPIEMAAEKKFKISVHNTPREEFVEKCKQILEETSSESIDTFKKLGISFSSYEKGDEIGGLYMTDSEEYRTMTQSTFIELWNKGLIYEDERINNYCPGCGTTIADSEIDYEMKNTYFNDVKFKVKETGEEIVIGTTRPELICTCGMIIFNPKDNRYQHLEGKTAVTPLFEKEVLIKAHPMAEIGKGTGLVMMCSAGDLSDIRFFREQKLEPVIAIGRDGRMNENAGFLKGLKVKEARSKIIEDLKEKGLLVGQKQTVHRTPICERSKHEVEFISMPEYYCKQLDYRDKMKELAEKLNFYSPKSRQIMLDWIKSVSMDWPISRRRFYATEIPLWYCECGEVIVPEKGKYYQPWKDKAPVDKCPKCGSTELRGEERVLDTWFDSSSSPLYILGYGRNQEFFDSHFPCSLRPQGKEIIRTWLYYSVLKTYLLNGKLVFDDAWINYHILDNKGNKMSKSKGNVIDPQKILAQHGAEAFRLWCATEGNLTGTDFRCSDERILAGGKTLTKLWNIARFISGFELDKSVEPKLLPVDEWILSELNELVEFSVEKFDAYDFHNPSVKQRNFLWEAFASHYLEMVKSRAYNSEEQYSKEDQQAAVQTLNKCLDILLKLLAPIVPFVTYRIFNELRGKDVHFEEFPKPVKEIKKPVFSTQELTEFNSAVWNYKKENGKRLNEGIESFKADSKLKCIEATIKAAHRIEKIEWVN